MKYLYLLGIPVVALLAAVIYIFFVYDPNPSKNTNNGVSIALDEPKQNDSPVTQTAAVKEAADFKIAPVTIPTAEESPDKAPSNEESQAEIVASDAERFVEPELSDAAETAENTLSTAIDNTSEEKSAEETATEAAPPAAVDDSTQESITSSAVDDSTVDPITPAAIDESIEATAAAPAAVEPIKDSLTEDTAAKRVTYVDADSIDIPQPVERATQVETDSAVSPQAVDSGDDRSRWETAAQVEEKQSKSIAANQQQLSGGYIEYKAEITSSLSQATADAGLSANQSARVGRILRPYLDSNRELRKGDTLTILLDPGVDKTGNDAEQIHRLEYRGARKNLVATRKEGSLNDYDVRDADGKMLEGEVPLPTTVVEEPRREAFEEPVPAVVAPPRQETFEEPVPAVVITPREETFEEPVPAVVAPPRQETFEEPVPAVVAPPRQAVSVEPAPAAVAKPQRQASEEPSLRRAAGDNTATDSIKRLEGVVTVSLFSAAREAGLNPEQLKKLEEILNPYINFNKEVRKGDRIVITLDGSEIQSSEYNGAVKKLTVARDDDGVYREVKPGDTDYLPGENGTSKAKKLPFWKRWFGFGSSSDEEDDN